MRGALFLIIVGLGGAAILIALGTWQVQRLAWKQGVIADIDARIVAEPVALPDTPDPVRDAYLPVKVNGLIGHQYLRVLVSEKERGAGYRIIASLRTDNRTKQETLLVDLVLFRLKQVFRIGLSVANTRLMSMLEIYSGLTKSTASHLNQT